MRYLVFLFFIFCLLSCQKEWVTDRQPQTFSQNNLGKTINDHERLLSGAYFILSSDHNALQDSPSSVYTMMSDNVSILSDNPYISDYTRQIYKRETENNEIGLVNAVWEVGYKVANSASIPISLIEKEGNPSDATQDQVNRILGESRFLRAFAHFQMIQLFAKPYSESNRNLPGIILKKEAAENGEGKKLNTIGEVYDFIVDDLTKAIELLPESYIAGSHPVEYKSGCRVKKDGARFLLAQVYFQMGKDVTYNGTSAWELALPLMNTVLTNAAYVLKEPKDYWLSYPGMDRPSEIVWEYSNLSWKNQKVVQLFMANKIAATGSTPKDRVFPVSNSLLTDAGWKKPDSINDFNGINDKRYLQLYVYILPSFDKSEGSYFQNIGKSYVWANMFAGYPVDTGLYRGYKIVNNVRVDLTVDKNNIRTPFFRIAEMHLLRATIYAAGIGGGNPKFDMDKILDRAGLSAEKKSSYTLTDVIREHRREFAFEGKRINYLKALRMTIPAGDPTSMDSHNKDERTDLTWDSEKLYWPIPRDEEIRNPNLYE